jgi:hypothetical protein
MKVLDFFQKILRWTACFPLAGGIAMGLWPGLSWAGPNSSPEEPPTITRAINIDEAGLSNLYYVVGSVDNRFAQGGLMNLSGEALLQLSNDWGLDLVIPDVVIQEPLGQGPAAMGPLGGGPRWVFGRFHAPKGEAGGVFSLEAQAFDWATPDSRFPGLASSYTIQALGALRVGRVYLQGNYGYNGAFDSGFTPCWSAFTALGYALGAHWALQVEGDFTDTILPSGGGMSGQWVLVPQLGFKDGGWLIEVGLGLTPGQSGTTTDFVLEKKLF